MLNKRMMVLLAAVTMAVAMLATAGMAWAASPTLSPTPDETWQPNGKVYSIVRHGDFVYVGGKFTRVVSPTGESFGATNLARFFADTGVGDKSWTPKVTGAAASGMATASSTRRATCGPTRWRCRPPASSCAKGRPSPACERPMAVPGSPASRPAEGSSRPSVSS